MNRKLKKFKSELNDNEINEILADIDKAIDDLFKDSSYIIEQDNDIFPTN